MFEPLPRLLLGLLTGFLFGLLLQKGRVAKYRVIVGQFLLRDWTVVKVMGTAVVVGAIGVYALRQMGVVSLHIKPTLPGGVVAGGALFGIGMDLLCFCPGASVAACGEGRRDAIAGVLGQLLGAGLFVAAYRWLDPVMLGLMAGSYVFAEASGWIARTVNQWGDHGELTVERLVGVKRVVFVPVAAVVVVAVHVLIDPTP